MISPLEWFKLNLKFGFLSIGGSARSQLYHEAVVEKHGWIKNEEFFEILTIAQMFPGPNLVNISIYLGYRLSGIRGAILGLLGLGVPGAFLTIAVISFIDLNNRHISWLFQGFSIGSISLSVLFVMRLSEGLATEIRRTMYLRFLLAIVVGVMVLTGVPLFRILMICGSASLITEFLL